MGKPAEENTTDFGRSIYYFHKIRHPIFFSDKAWFTLSSDLYNQIFYSILFYYIILYYIISPGPRLCLVVRNIVSFYGEELLAPRPIPKLEGHPFSAVRDCLLSVFTATLHIRRPFLHPQPEEAPCCGDRDPFIILYIIFCSNLFCSILFFRFSSILLYSILKNEKAKFKVALRKYLNTHSFYSVDECFM